MSILNLEESFKKAEQDNVQHFYLLINVENAVFKDVACENYYAYPIDPYNGAIEALQKISNRDDIKIIFSSNMDNLLLSKIFHFLKNNGILNYQYNKNAQVTNIGNRYYTNSNFYFNYQLDKRSGFEPETDWVILSSEIDNFVFNKSSKSAFDDIMTSIDDNINGAYEYFDLKEEVLLNTTEILFNIDRIKREAKYFLLENKYNNRDATHFESVVDYLGARKLIFS